MYIAFDVSTPDTVVTEPSSFEVYQDIEKSIETVDEWSQLSAWAFHQALSLLIKEAYRKGEAVVVTGNVPFDLFDKMMMSNLSHELWHREREIYESIP